VNCELKSVLLCKIFAQLHKLEIVNKIVIKGYLIKNVIKGVLKHRIYIRRYTKLYTERVIEEFKNPKHTGEMADATATGVVGGAECGDIMNMYLKIENDVVVDASFLTYGCAAAIATSSVATDLIIGKTVDEALKISNKQVIEQLGGLPAQKIHCSVMAEESIKAAIDDYRARQNA